MAGFLYGPPRKLAKVTDLINADLVTHITPGPEFAAMIRMTFDVITGTLITLNRICLSITAALAISSFASIASPSRVSAEIASVQDALEEEVLEQEAFEQVAVAFAMMTWLPRLEGACDLYKKGFFAESELPEAYRTLYQSYVVENPTPESAKTFSKLMELLEGGPQAMAEYFQEDNAEEFDGKFFTGCPLPTKALGF